MNSNTMELPTRELAAPHLGHEHPLEYKNAGPPRPQDMQCSGCKLKVSPGMGYYCCKTCSFVLHRVCYNVTRELQHPAHVDHPLKLLDAPSNCTSTSNLTCGACGQRVNGMYYSCETCHVFYHALCSALPLNVPINNHPHILKLEFSLPYEFQCDLCSKPSHRGWVYRCGLCEFDTHLGCAIVNQRGGSYQHSPVSPEANALLRATYLPKTSDTEWTNGLDVSMSKELAILVAQNMARGAAEGTGRRSSQRKVAQPIEVANLSLTKENVGIGNGRTLNSEFSHTEQSQNEDKSARISLDGATPSFQSSDACFSIDLAKSYSTVPEKHQREKQPKRQNTAIISCTIEQASSTGSTATSNRKHELATRFSFNNKAMDGTLNEGVFFDWGRAYSTQHMNDMDRNTNAKGAMTRSDTGILGETSEIATSSCWAKSFSCCYQRNYKQMFKDGGS